jgi:uncharacterized protein involved in exopolysaccharide biosynthesis
MSMSQQEVSEKKSTTNVNQLQASLYKPRQITMNQQKSQIDNLEQELEAEIKRETKSVPDTKIAR